MDVANVWNLSVRTVRNTPSLQKEAQTIIAVILVGASSIK